MKLLLVFVSAAALALSGCASATDRNPGYVSLGHGGY